MSLLKMRKSHSLNCEVPKSYIFKERKDLMRNDGLIFDRLEPAGDEYIPEKRWNPQPRRSSPVNQERTPKSYVFRRIQFSNGEMQKTSDDESIINRRPSSSDRDRHDRDTSQPALQQKGDRVGR